MLPDDRYNEPESFMAMASKSGHEFRAYDDALDFIAGRRPDTVDVVLGDMVLDAAAGTPRDVDVIVTISGSHTRLATATSCGVLVE